VILYPFSALTLLVERQEGGYYVAGPPLLNDWMGDVHHCSGPPSPKWPILCRVGR